MCKLKEDKNKTLNWIETHYKAIESIRMDKEHNQPIRIEEQNKQPNDNWFYGAENGNGRWSKKDLCGWIHGREEHATWKVIDPR